DEMIGLRKWHRSQQHAVHDAEDRGVRADAECERRDRGERERGGCAQLPKRVADILPELAHDVTPPLCGFDVVIHRFDVASRVVEVAEFSQGSRLCGVRCEPCRDQRIDAHVEMEAKLLVHVAIDLPRRAPWKSKELSVMLAHAGSSTLNTAAAYCRHAVSSALSCRR